MGWRKGRLERNLLVVEVVSAASEASDEDVDSFSGPVSVTRVHFEAMWIGWKATACFRIDSKLQSKDSRGTDLDLMVTFGRKNNCRCFVVGCWPSVNVMSSIVWMGTDQSCQIVTDMQPAEDARGKVL
jgi:hypothetical protein